MKNLKLYIIILAFILFGSVAFSQGIIRGKITDENGEALLGATVVLKSQSNVGTMADFNGQYSLKIATPGPQVIVVSFIGYQKIEESVDPINGEIIIKDFSMTLASSALDEAVIVGKVKKVKDVYMEKVQIKSAVSLNYISAETIKKIGDTNVSSAVARVSGVSTNGSFITVRGIGDRYMKTAINGMRIPTLDPFTNNIKLDMFPASLVDNIVLVKTASPDLPADWAGAYLSVETKDYPEKLTVHAESSFGYNQQSSFKEVVSSERSSTDWLGFDNSMRDINHDDFVSVFPSPTTFQEFVALGLGDFYKALGVTQDSWKNDGSEISKTYTRLGLSELGFLDKNKFNDPIAFTNALNQYNSSPERKQAFDLINAQGIEIQNRLFPNNWNTVNRKAPLSQSQSFSIGNQITLFGRPLGFIAGFRYSNSMMNDPDFISHKFYRELEIGKTGSNNWITGSDTTIQKASKETNGWSALFNIAYKYSDKNSISILFMPNFFGVNNVRDGFIYQSLIKTDEPFDSISSRRQSKYYEQRRQIVTQIKSENYIPAIRMKIELNTSYTSGHSKVPDFSSLRPGDPTDNRYFRYLSENVFDSRLLAELPIGSTKESGVAKIRFGGNYQYNIRNSDQYNYMLMGGFFYNSRIVDSNLNRYYEEYGHASNHSTGYSDVKAGFAMLDYPISKAIRFSGGIRVEKANIFADISLYDSLNIPADDLRRVEIQLPLNPGNIYKINFLPSVNLIIKLRQDEMAPINLRLNFSQTLARPSIREISSYSVYDNELKANVRGNPNLKLVEINNYDLRFEAYSESGNNFSLSAFHKDFKNHIEFFNYGSGQDGVGMRWQNSPFNSWLNGIELDGKLNISTHFEVRANLTLVKSLSKMDLSYTNEYGNYFPGDTVTHAMLGQAPYIINTVIAYNSDKMGLSAALSFNRQGQRLVISGMYDQPDIYEMPRNQLDFRASKNFGKHFGLSLKIQDILNSSVIRTYKFDNKYHLQGFLLDYDKYTWGTSYVFAISYKF